MSDAKEAWRAALAEMGGEPYGTQEDAFCDGYETAVQVLDSAQHFVDVLNRVHESDPTVLPALIAHRVPCNNILAKDPTVQVGLIPSNGTDTIYADVDRYEVGLLGILNGITGVNAWHYGYIAAVYDDAGTLVRFDAEPEMGKPKDETAS